MSPNSGYTDHVEWGSLAAVLTAAATLITAIGGVIVTVKVMIPNFKVNKSTHTIVNQQRTDMLRFQKTLINTLNLHGIDIPEDQSKLDE